MKTQCSLVFVIILMVSCVAWAVDPPVVYNLGVGDVTTCSATLKGYLYYDGGEACSVRFSYWRYPSGTVKYTPWRSGVHSTETFAEPITGLVPDTQYKYIVVATNSVATSWDDYIFYTHTPSAPSVYTWDAQNITETSATLKCGLDCDCGTGCQIRFTYWTGGGPEQHTPWKSNEGTAGYETVDGLSPNTVYSFKAEAKNSEGQDTGSTRTFTTLAGETVTLTISSTDGGSVTNPGEGAFEYDEGTVVTITATADANYVFTQWTGTAVNAGKVANSSASSTTVTVDADYNLRANFEYVPPSPLTHTLGISSSAGGSVTTPGEGWSFEYDEGTEVTLIATADPNYQFSRWTGTAVSAGKVANSSASSTTVTVDADYNLWAIFIRTEPDAPSVKGIVYVDATDGEYGNTTLATGEVLVAPDPGTVGSGADGLWRIRAFANEGTIFVAGGSWEENGNTEDCPRLVTSVTVPENTYAVYAYFWSDPASWRIRASLTDDENELPLYIANDPNSLATVADGNDFTGVVPMLAQGNRLLWQVFLGYTGLTTMVNVYIDDDPNHLTHSACTWYDGIGYTIASPRIVYVDATDGRDPNVAANTTLATGEAFTATGGNDGTDGLWRPRAYGTNATIFEANGANDGNPNDEVVPRLKTTIEVPEKMYAVYVYFWCDTSSWRIKAGLENTDELPLYIANDPNGGATVADVNDFEEPIPLLTENTRTLWQAYLGTTGITSSISVYIDSDPRPEGDSSWNQRTWYDGIGYMSLCEPEPNEPNDLPGDCDIVQAINCGGDAVGHFDADHSYQGGGVWRTSATIKPEIAPQEVLCTERNGSHDDFTYCITNLIPGAEYELRLYFAEIYWNGSEKRLFKVFINHVLALDDYDIFAEAGDKNKAICEVFTVHADNLGMINIFFEEVKDMPKCSGIEICERIQEN